MNVWDTPSWDHHLIKLGRGRDGNKDEREWIFGMSIALKSLSIMDKVDRQTESCPPSRIMLELTPLPLEPMYTVSRLIIQPFTRLTNSCNGRLQRRHLCVSLDVIKEAIHELILLQIRSNSVGKDPFIDRVAF